jgi:hypothetical protein
MWLGEVDVDGRTVRGVLLNSPNWLTSVAAGDAAEFPLTEITDWMYAVEGKVYGGHTVQHLRAGMSPRERKEHDTAWGLDFGDPAAVRLVPRGKGWFAGGPDDEHPMSEAMAPSLRGQLAEDPSYLEPADDGWTLLHHQALAGSAATVKVLLECGADPNAVTGHGMTPVQLARSLGWDRVVTLLAGHGAKG